MGITGNFTYLGQGQHLNFCVFTGERVNNLIPKGAQTSVWPLRNIENTTF